MGQFIESMDVNEILEKAKNKGLGGCSIFWLV
jgi:hypothetical protein